MEDVYNDPLVCLWSVETPLQGPSPSDYPGDRQALGGPHEQGLEDVVVELWVVLTGPVAVASRDCSSSPGGVAQSLGGRDERTPPSPASGRQHRWLWTGRVRG